MNEDETPLHQIVWQRVLKRIGEPPAWVADDSNLFNSLGRNWWQIGRAGLFTISMLIVVVFQPLNLVLAWNTIKKTLPGYENHTLWYIAGVFLLLSLFGKWILGVFARFWRYCLKTRFGLLVAFAGVAIVYGGRIETNCSLPAVVGGATVFFCAILSHLWRAEEWQFTVPDSLHRRYFANRLAEIFSDPLNPVRRVAIMGEWGAGKTRVLELLAERLRRNRRTKFKVAFVNPWKAQSVEEAWGMIAAEVDLALGYVPLLPQVWAKHPILRGLIDLIPLAGISRDLLELLLTHGAESRDLAIGKINASLASLSCKVVVLVDDMERTDSKVLRQMLPIIDQVADLKGISFVFAIDPDRVAAAFEEKEKGRGGEHTKGYLDKVFDLQLELPPPTVDDICKMVRSEAVRQNAKKLAEALPKFEALLPQDPRLALQFLELAITKETLFLVRYGLNERSYAPLFLSWLIEVEFPGFLKALNKNETDFGIVSQTPLFSNEISGIRKQQQFEPLIRNLLKELKADDPDQKIRLEDLVEKLAELGGDIWDKMVAGSASFSVEWARSGHLILTELSHSERERLRLRWRRYAGNCSIQTMINEEFRKADLEFVDEIVCGKQLITFEIERIFESIRRVRSPEGVDVEAVCGEIVEDTDCLRRHHEFLNESRLIFDLQCFGAPVFRAWFHGIVEQPLEHEDVAVGRKLDSARIAFSFELAKALPLVEAHTLAQWEIDRILEQRGHGRDVKRAALHGRDLKVMLLARVTEYVLDCLRAGKLNELFDERGFAGRRGWGFLFDPRNWLWTEENAWQNVLSGLEVESKSNVTFARSCSEICYSLFVHPAECEQCGGEHRRERSDMKLLEERFPGYIGAFWHASLNSDISETERNRLLVTRQRALLKAEKGGDLTAEFLNKIFPIKDSR